MGITPPLAAKARDIAVQGGIFILYRRVYLMMVFILVLFLVLLGRFVWIQLYRGEELAAQAVALRTRQIEMKEYPRGQILDRNRVPLTDSTITSALYGIPDEMVKNTSKSSSPTGSDNQDRDEVMYKLGSILYTRNVDGIKSTLQQAIATGKPVVRLVSDLTTDEVRRINASGLAGLIVAPEIKRYRPDGFAVHLLGYVGGGNPVQGLAGLEKYYDSLLHEQNQAARLTSIQDARGLAIKGLMFKVQGEDEVPRGSLVLTIDKRLQQTVEDVMNKRVGKGAVVVMDVQTKQILAMASRPYYNPYNVETAIEKGQNGSLNNRALLSYPPGSLFKLLIATAALEEGKVKTNEVFVCNGEHRFNPQVAISCWKKEGHGKIRFDDAFAQSCNCVFIDTGLRLGRERLMHYVRQLHLDDERIDGFNCGQAGTGVLIEGGDAALGNASIGQQGVMLSPVQLCSLVSTIADNGVWGRPSLVSYTIDSSGGKKSYTNTERFQVIRPDTAKKIRSLMAKTVSQGTGQSAAPAEIGAAGKTGTGQTGNIGRDKKELLNTWFAGYFPVEQPRWAVVVLVEEGRSGAEDAAPVFKDIAARIVKTLAVNNQ